MTFLNKKWMACFYSFLIIGLFFGELREATGGVIQRSILFPREEEDLCSAIEKSIWRRFPAGSVEIEYITGQDEDERTAFFIHKTSNQPSGETLKPRGVLYYFKNGEFFKVSSENTSSPHLEKTFMGTGFALWSYAAGKSRNFCIFDLKKRVSEVVARGFRSLIVQENRKPIAGVKMTPEVMGFYVNVVSGGWKLLEEAETDPSLMDPFIYEQSSKSLFFCPNYVSWRIDLETGEIEPHSVVYGDPSCASVERRWSCDSGFRCFRKKIGGLDTWTGNALFNFVFKQMVEKLTNALKGESFSVVHAGLCPDFGVHFQLNTNAHSHRSGIFKLETETIEFDPVLEKTHRMLLEECLSKKIYGEMSVPRFYGMSDWLLGLSYYVSYPPKGQAPFPAVALVHGGPNASDEFGFDPQVQHLTSRGYTVVQVNYRGSADSRDRAKAGIGQAGDSMQRDVIQVLDYLIGQGLINKDNIAIMGGSYGGYAALVAATRGVEFHTELFRGFKCAMASYPTSSLLRTVEESMCTDENRTPLSVHLMAPSVLKTGSISPDDRERLHREAPLTHAKSLYIPLLLVHGTHDSITPIAHSLDFAQACDPRFLEGLIVAEEEHGWQNPGNSRAISYAAEVFLNKYLHGGEVEPLTMEDVLFTDMEFMRGAQNFPELQEMLEKYRGFGNLHLSVDALNWLFPHPQRYSFPYPQYFAHEGNAISAPRRTLKLRDLYRVLDILVHARNYFVLPLI